METTTHSTLQNLMNQAYARYKDQSQSEFWDQLDEREKIAVFVGNANYQVENGGWAQWCDNRYVECADELRAILTRIGTPTCLTVASMVLLVSSAYEEYKEEDNRGGYFECTCGAEDEEDEPFDCTCEEEDPYADFTYALEGKDDAFYAINAQLMDEVESYLNGTLTAPSPDDAALAPHTRKEGDPLYDVYVKLTGRDGNAFSIMGAVTNGLRKAGADKTVIDTYQAESMAGDYDNLLRTAMKYVHVS